MGAQRHVKKHHRSHDTEMRPRVLGHCCMGTNFPRLVQVSITTHNYLLPFLKVVTEDTLSNTLRT